MKKVMVGLSVFFLLSFTNNSETKVSDPMTREEVYAWLMRTYPGITYDEKGASPEEDPDARKTCFSVGWTEISTGCIGQTTVCHHTFLFWDWMTYTDNYVHCP